MSKRKTVCWVAVLLQPNGYILPVVTDDNQTMSEWDTEKDAHESMALHTAARAWGYNVFEVKS